jgi:hypothetical protein
MRTTRSFRAPRGAVNYSEQGHPSAKVTTIGKGESQPVATNKTAEGRQNRRVDIEFKGVCAVTNQSSGRKPRSGGVFCS